MKEGNRIYCKNLNLFVCPLYLADPVVESGDSGEDSGFLLIVAAKARDEAGNAMNLPDTLGVLTVQRAAWVALDTEGEEECLCFIHLMELLVDWQGTAMRILIRIIVSPSITGDTRNNLIWTHSFH